MAFPEVFRRRKLPHWDVEGAIYFITACLEGSIPAQGLLDIDRVRNRLRNRRPPDGLTAEQWKARCWKVTFARADHWLDRCPAVRRLSDPRLAAQVVEAIHHFRAVRYEVY